MKVNSECMDEAVQCEMNWHDANRFHVRPKFLYSLLQPAQVRGCDPKQPALEIELDEERSRRHFPCSAHEAGGAHLTPYQGSKDHAEDLVRQPRQTRLGRHSLSSSTHDRAIQLVGDSALRSNVIPSYGVFVSVIGVAKVSRFKPAFDAEPAGAEAVTAHVETNDPSSVRSS
jgi:hypothetical protein